MVGVQGFEPWTPCSQSRCATRLRYTPTEPIFYTERAISGKSCNIRHMIALFSSKLNKQVHAIVVAILLAFCLLGMHWVGLNHGVSHLGLVKQTVCESAAVASMPTTAHSSDVCHLYDALMLAGCIPPSFSSAPLASHNQSSGLQSKAAQVDAPSLIAYQSQAPPSFIL